MLKIMFVLFSICLTLFSKDYSAYMKVVDVNGEVKILSSKYIVKPANLSDLLFTKDNIITGNNANITAYLENKFLFKLESNSSISLLETYDKNSNIHIKLDNGDIILSSELSNSILKVSTPNTDFVLSGTAIMQYNNNVTRILFLNGTALLSASNIDNSSIKEFSEIIIDNSNIVINDLVMNEDLRNYIKIIINLPYIEKVSSVDIYQKIITLKDGDLLNSINNNSEK